MNDDIIFGTESDLPRSIKKLNDIKLIVPEGTDQYVPVYATDVNESFLESQALQAKKTVTFPWNSSLTEIQPLAGNLLVGNGQDTTQTIVSQVISNVNSADNSVLDEYVDGIV